MQDYWVKHGYGKYSNVYPKELYNGHEWLKYMQGNYEWASKDKASYFRRHNGIYINGRDTSNSRVTWAKIKKDYRY